MSFPVKLFKKPFKLRPGLLWAAVILLIIWFCWFYYSSKRKKRPPAPKNIEEGIKKRDQEIEELRKDCPAMADILAEFIKCQETDGKIFKTPVELKAGEIKEIDLAPLQKHITGCYRKAAKKTKTALSKLSEAEKNTKISSGKQKKGKQAATCESAMKDLIPFFSSPKKPEISFKVKSIKAKKRPEPEKNKN